MKLVNFGSLNIDYTFRVSEIVRPGQTIDSLSEQCSPGGKGLNQSLAAARAGAEVCHAGSVGEDGAFLRQLLEADDVDCRFLRTVETGTGKAFIQVERSGQNCIVLSAGANRTNTREFCDTVLSEFGPGDILLLQNEINEIDYLIECGAQRGMTVVLNPSPMNEGVLACDLSKVSMFILNEDEGALLTGAKSEEDILTGLEQKYPNAKIILTLGDKGSTYAFHGERVHQASFPVETVDTTGAGDTFTGYLLAGYMKGEPMDKCLETAARAAAIAVTRHGAARAIPRKEELDRG